MILESECLKIFMNLLNRLVAAKKGSFSASSEIIQCHEYGLTLGECDLLLRDIIKIDADRRTISIHRSQRTSSSSSSSSNNNNNTNEEEVVNSVLKETLTENGITKESSTDDGALDITGTPLECPFDLNDETITHDNESIERNGYLLESGSGNISKLSILEASVFQNVVCEFLLEDQSELDADLKSFPFVIVCDGNDSRGTLFLGYRKIDSRLERFKVTCNGTLLSVDELPKLEKLIRHHSSGFSPRHIVETKAKATYCILERASNDLELKNQSNIELTCEWNGVDCVLEIPNGDATCSIKFDVSLGDIRNAAHEKFQELILLQDLAKGLITGEITWTTTVHNESSVETDVIELLEGLKVSGSKVKREYNKKNRNSDFGTFDLDRQRNMDFTDKFWNVLKGSRSLNELARSMDVVLETVQHREIKPIIFNSNRTSFGKIISNIAHRKGTIPKMFGIEPLQMLVEMGIEKLKQDYAYILLSSGLVQKDSLDPFFTPRAESKIDLQIDLTSLRKLHCTVELVSLCNTFVDPAHMILGAYARNALNNLNSVSIVDSLMSFTFRIERKAMKSVLGRVRPLMWQVTMISQQDSYFSQTAYRFTTGHPVHDAKSKIPKISVDDSKDAPLYYTCVGTLLRDEI